MAACHTAGRPCLHRRTPFSLTAALRGDLHPLLSSPGAFLYAGAFLFLEQSWSLCLRNVPFLSQEKEFTACKAVMGLSSRCGNT